MLSDFYIPDRRTEKSFRGSNFVQTLLKGIKTLFFLLDILGTIIVYMKILITNYLTLLYEPELSGTRDSASPRPFTSPSFSNLRVRARPRPRFSKFRESARVRVPKFF